MMRISATKLRQDIYNLLDRVLESGEPLTITRKGRELLIVPTDRNDIDWDHLCRRKTIQCPIDELDEIDWEAEWRPND